MSAFSDKVKKCMALKGMPLPTLEDLGELKEFVDHLHDAWEQSGGEIELTMGALIEALTAAGISTEWLEAAGIGAGVAVNVYINACLGCVATAGILSLPELFASSAPQPYMKDGLANAGLDPEEINAAVA